MIVGQNLKIVNTMDQVMADSQGTMFTIDILLTKSPQKKVKCGAIAVYRQHQEMEGIDWKEGVDPLEKFEAQKSLNEMTEIMLRPPELFKASQNKWVPWAIKRALTIFDELNTDADIVIKSPNLKVKHVLTRNMILTLRSDPRELFKTAFEIDALLNGDFEFDPWRKLIRRGRIGADVK